MSNVLILGGTGNLGSHLTQELLNQTDDQITVFARHANNQQSNSRLHFIHGDATNQTDLSQALNGQNVVYCAIQAVTSQQSRKT